MTVIPNWADGHAITPVAHDDNPLRRDWGLEGKFVVGYSGNLGRAHEFETILGAAERLKNDPRIRFLFIGSGAQAESVRTAAAKRGLDNLMFQPYQPREMLKFSLGAADAHLVVLRPDLEGLIVPSKTYGCLAAGRPVIFMGDPQGEIGRMLAGVRCGAVMPCRGRLPNWRASSASWRRTEPVMPALGRTADFERDYDRATTLRRDFRACSPQLATRP